MKENAVIFYFRTGGDAFSQKKINVVYDLCILSDSFVLYSCSCHVLLAEFRTSANLTGFHVFALMHILARIFYFRTGSDAFSQKNERIVVKAFFSQSLSYTDYTPVAAICFLSKHLGESDSL